MQLSAMFFFTVFAEEEWPTTRPSLKAPVLRLTRGGYRKHPYGRYWRCSKYVTSDFKLFIIFFKFLIKCCNSVYFFSPSPSEIEIKNNPIKHINPQNLVLLQYLDVFIYNKSNFWKNTDEMKIDEKDVHKICCLNALHSTAACPKTCSHFRFLTLNCWFFSALLVILNLFSFIAFNAAIIKVYKPTTIMIRLNNIFAFVVSKCGAHFKFESSIWSPFPPCSSLIALALWLRQF